MKRFRSLGFLFLFVMAVVSLSRADAVTADDTTASSRGSDAVPAHSFMPRAGGGQDGRPLTAENQFLEANRLYAGGDYAGAAQAYEHMIQSGFGSGNLYYNLGNAYFKLSQKGRAMAAYERARKLIPQDEDLFANLSFVTLLLEEAQPEDQKSWQEKMYHSLRDVLPASGWFWLAVVLCWSIAAILGVAIFHESFRRRVVILAVGLGIFLLATLFFYRTRFDFEHHTKVGVIVAPEVEVRYSPSYTGAVAFKLHEGLKAQMLEEEGEWRQIRLSRNKSGWVESESIEEI